MPVPPEGRPQREGLDIRETASALADATDDPTLKALLRARPLVAVILLSHPGDHLEITASGVSVTYGNPGEEGTVRISPNVLAALRDTRPPQADR